MRHHRSLLLPTTCALFVACVGPASAPALSAWLQEAPEAESARLWLVDDRVVRAVVPLGPGAVPQLARERIETVFDESWGALARLLESWRDRIRSALPEVNARRRFYERALRGSIARLVKDGRSGLAEVELAAALSGPEGREIGSVVLVGAGPGDPGLLTLNAFRALQEADVILHDRLVSVEILDLARRDADRIPVGKAAGAHSVPQSRINELLVEHARAGRRVVRLKGGDPFVFGRGGEELEELAKQGIPFQVVPGITAAVACAAYSGIPLTHRDHAQAVTLVTAHCGESIERLDWAALARPAQTVAFYMGVAALGRIAGRLETNGRDPATPVAVVENGSRHDQQVTLCSLRELPELALRGSIKSPALLIVGEVAALAASLHWFGRPPSRHDDRQAVQFVGRRIVDPARQGDSIDAAGKAQPGYQDRGVGIIDRPAIEVSWDREAVARRA